MKSDVLSIYWSERTGAYGIKNLIGTWVFGRCAKNGKIISCRVRQRSDHMITVKGYRNKHEYITEFTVEEWGSLIPLKRKIDQIKACDEILRKRRLVRFADVVAEKSSTVG